VPLLQKGDLLAADSAFRQAIALDNRNYHAFHGRGLVALLRNPTDSTATTLLETAYYLAPKDPPPRTLMYNLAAAHLPTNPMRAARFALIFLSHPQSMTDEPMANALGAALNMADYSSRNNRFFETARDFYLKYDLRLAAARNDGMMRWGTQWLAEADAKARWDNYRQRTHSVAQLRAEAAEAARARQRLDAVGSFQTKAWNREYAERAIAEHDGRRAQAAALELQLRQQLSQAEAGLNSDVPPLLTKLAPILDP
jgi:hypothetical protein